MIEQPDAERPNLEREVKLAAPPGFRLPLLTDRAAAVPGLEARLRTDGYLRVLRLAPGAAARGAAVDAVRGAARGGARRDWRRARAAAAARQPRRGAGAARA